MHIPSPSEHGSLLCVPEVVHEAAYDVDNDVRCDDDDDVGEEGGGWGS